MKVSVNGKEVITLSTYKKNVIKNDIHSEIFDIDMKRRVVYWIMDNLFGKALNRLKRAWNKELPNRGIQDLPTNDIAYAQLILSQPEYSSVPSFSPSSVEVDDVELFQVPAEVKKIMYIVYRKPDVDALIEQQAAWIINHKYEKCMERCRLEWESKLKNDGATTLPARDEDFTNLVMAHPEYKNRSVRELEKKANNGTAK